MESLKAYTKKVINEMGINTFMAVKNQLANCTNTSPTTFYKRLKTNRENKKTAKDAACFLRNELHIHFKEFAQYQ